LSYEEFHLIAGMAYVFFGVLGGLYALKALRALYRCPEMLRTQQNIWIPVLLGGGFFTIGGIFYFTEHSCIAAFNCNPEIDLLRNVTCLTGFLLLNIGVIRYSQLQIEYYKLKRKALEKILKKQYEN
jgi:hypothetical protein